MPCSGNVFDGKNPDDLPVMQESLYILPLDVSITVVTNTNLHGKDNISATAGCFRLFLNNLPTYAPATGQSSGKSQIFHCQNEVQG